MMKKDKSERYKFTKETSSDVQVDIDSDTSTSFPEAENDKDYTIYSYHMLRDRFKTLEGRITEFKAETKESIKEIKDDIKKLKWPIWVTNFISGITVVGFIWVMFSFGLENMEKVFCAKFDGIAAKLDDNKSTLSEIKKDVETIKENQKIDEFKINILYNKH